MSNKYERRISYVLSTRNRANFLKEALSRFAHIKQDNDELIIVDGGSTDNTDKIVDDFAKIVDIYISEPDKNGEEAYNKGYLIARGKYIKQLTDDDYYFEDGLKKAYSVMEENPEVDMIICGGIRKENNKETLIYVPPGANYGSSVDEIFINGYTTSGMGMFFRHSMLPLVGLSEVDRPFPDMGFILRSIYIGANVKFCRINMFLHPLRKDSITIKTKDEYVTEYKLLLNRYCSKEFKKKYFIKNLFWYKLPSQIYKKFTQLLTLIKYYKRRQIIDQKPVWDSGFS